MPGPEKNESRISAVAEQKAVELVENLKEGSTLEFGDEFLAKLDREGVAVEDVLGKLVEHGIIFHGSDKKIPVLQPRQAYDHYRMTGRQVAVYATDTPEIAIFCAIRSRERASKISRDVRSTYGVTSNEKKFTASRAYLETLADGYVHLLPKGKFKPVIRHIDKVYFDHPMEFLSRQELVPLATIKVRPKDFRYPIEPMSGK